MSQISQESIIEFAYIDIIKYDIYILIIEDHSDSESSSNEVLSAFLKKNIGKKGQIGIQGTSTMFGKKSSDHEFASSSGTMVKIEIKVS